MTRSPRNALAELAAAANAAARAVLEAGGGFGSKAFISEAYDRLPARWRNGLTLAQFKAQLVDANRAGLVRLTRADLVQAMPPMLVRASETHHLHAAFHFLQPRRLRENKR